MVMEIIGTKREKKQGEKERDLGNEGLEWKGLEWKGLEWNLLQVLLQYVGVKISR